MNIHVQLKLVLSAMQWGLISNCDMNLHPPPYLVCMTMNSEGSDERM